MNREQELNYIVERFAQKFKESQHKYPFLSDPKIQEGFLKLLAETIIEDTKLLNALNELGYDKVKTLLQPLIDQAFAKMEEKIEEAKKEVEKEVENVEKKIDETAEMIDDQHTKIIEFNGKGFRGAYDLIKNSRDAILSSVSEMKSNMMTKKDAQDLNWLNSRTW